jgi:excisionase family DNA binding protein
LDITPDVVVIIIESLSMANKIDDILTIDELAAYLKISKSTLYKLVREGKIPAQKIGRHWRFRKKVIDQWLEKTQTAWEQ